MPAKINMEGQVFNRITVIREAGRDKWGQVLWECSCVCGRTFYARGIDIRSGKTKSCGCLSAENAAETIKKQTVNHSNPKSIMSKKISTANTSGVRGVSQTKRGRWRAYIGYKGKQIYLGEFARLEDAVAARKAGEERYFKPILEELGK